MKEFKFFKKNNDESSLLFEPQTDMLTRYGGLAVNPNYYTTLTINPNAGLTTIDTTNTRKDYCFQFNGNEPVVFATSVDPLTITLTGNGGQSTISFTDSNTNNTFTLFSRPSENI